MIFIYQVNIQALSVNKGYTGRKFKTQAYKDYERDIKLYLSTVNLPRLKPRQKFYLYLEFGIPTRQDASNGIKLLEDILTSHMGVNDRHTMALYCKKVITRKEDCYIKFNIFLSEHELIEEITSGEVSVGSFV